MTGRSPRVIRGTNEPPEWGPATAPHREFGFDGIPVDRSRIRIEQLEPDVAARVIALGDGDDAAVALPGAQGASEGIVTIRIGDRQEVLGRLPPGYGSYYASAADRRVAVIPLESWDTPDGPVIDLAMGRAPEYGGSTGIHLATSRLIIRPLSSDDTAALVAYRGDPEVCRYLPFPAMDEAEIARRLETQWHRTTLEQDGDSVTVGVTASGTGVIGDVVLFLRSREHGVGEIGWVFSPLVAGRGFATEAAAAMLHQAFRSFGLRRVIARLDERNLASARLCERLGMRLEARLVDNEVFKGELSTELDYAVLEREWVYPAHRRAD